MEGLGVVLRVLKEELECCRGRGRLTVGCDELRSIERGVVD